MFDDIKSVLKTEIRNSWLVHGVKKEVLDRALNMKYKYGIPGDPLKQKLAKKLATMVIIFYYTLIEIILKVKQTFM